MVADIRFTPQVKSILSSATIWRLEESPNVWKQFAVKVPNTPETQPLLRWLESQRPHFASYMPPGRKVASAFQWLFDRHAYRSLWLEAKKVARVLED